MKHIILLFTLGTLSFGIACAEWKPSEELIRASTERWGEDIARLEAKDQMESHPDDAILFIGSSSIRLWKTIAEDVAPYHAIQRGYGGARFSDLVVFAEQLITPHKFRALVIFVANDVSGETNHATPEEVTTWFRFVCSVARKHQPDAEIFCIEITPTAARWNLWPKSAAVNSALAAECAGDDMMHFIPTASAYLNSDGEPREELFIGDKLHLNRLGYHIWGGIVTSHLDRILRVQQAAR